MRLALGIAYRGVAYHGWQSQADGRTVQDVLERALGTFADTALSTVCAGRTDAGVHALRQVVHLDTDIDREAYAWVRGTNRYLPDDVAVQWCHRVDDAFHARASARARSYRYVLLESPVRPALASGMVGWAYRPLDGQAMRAAAEHLIGEHDFSSFRASQCQALSPVKHLRRIEITRHGRHWHLEFEASAFLHHMVRNIVGSLVVVGRGREPPGWMLEVLNARSRDAAAPTFGPEGLYFMGPTYDDAFGLPSVRSTDAAHDDLSWLHAGG
jgi:tRNA pseudouridine38-40 synthase